LSPTRQRRETHARKQPHSIHAEMKHRIETIEGKDRLVYDFVVKDGDIEFFAVDVFDRMFSFWERLYRELGFIEDRYIDGN
jgi:hypothetical protein